MIVADPGIFRRRIAAAWRADQFQFCGGLRTRDYYFVKFLPNILPPEMLQANMLRANTLLAKAPRARSACVTARCYHLGCDWRTRPANVISAPAD